MDWLERTCANDLEPEVFSVHGIEVMSEIVSVKQGCQEDGQEFLAVRVRSSHGDRNIENIATVYMRPDMSPARFRASVQASRQWFADQFAKEYLGTASQKPIYWLVALSNPINPARRIQGLAVCDPNAPKTMIMRDFCEPLGLSVTNGDCEVLLRVLGKRFLVTVAATDLSILSVIGKDLIERAIAEDSDRTRLLESLFLDSAARAYAARRKSKAKTVLVIGSYEKDGIQRLRIIEGHLFQVGYEPVLLADYPSDGESLEAKMLSFATLSRFVMYEATFASGGIDEFSICRNNQLITAVLHQQGKMATSVQTDYALEHGFIKFFPYEEANLAKTTQLATEWAETVVSSRQKFYQTVGRN